MRKIAVRVGKVWFQFEGGRIRLNGIGYIVVVFVNARQIAVRVGERWVYLDGSSVALKSASRVVHLFQRIACRS